MKSPPRVSAGATGTRAIWTTPDLTIKSSRASGISTVAGNSSVSGGGIYLQSATGTLNNSTLSGNSAGPNGGANVFSASSTLFLKSTVLANGGSGRNCSLSSGTTLSSGFNLSDDASCSAVLTGTGDRNSTAAGLDSGGLKNNGGPTLTIALLASSVAIDAIPPGACTAVDGTPITTDQRGTARPQGPGCDIGAFEFTGTPTPTPTTPPATPIPPSSTLGLLGLAVSGLYAACNKRWKR